MSLLIIKLGVTIIRGYCTATPALSTSAISLHVSFLRLLVGLVEIQSEDLPNDAKQRKIRVSFTRRLL